jgi:hypothetical protein
MDIIYITLLFLSSSSFTTGNLTTSVNQTNFHQPIEKPTEITQLPSAGGRPMEVRGLNPQPRARARPHPQSLPRFRSLCVAARILLMPSVLSVSRPASAHRWLTARCPRCRSPPVGVLGASRPDLCPQCCPPPVSRHILASSTLRLGLLCRRWGASALPSEIYWNEAHGLWICM